MAEAARDQNRVTTLLGVSSVDFLTSTTAAVNPTTHAVLIEGSFTPPALQNVNLTQIGSAALAFGQALSSASIPVVFASDQSAIGLAAGTNGIGKLTANSGVIIGAIEIAAAQTLATVTTLTGGGVAAAATDSGNPIKVGAKFNTTTPTYTDGQRTDLHTDARGNLNSVLRVSGSGNPIVAEVDNADAVAVSATANKFAVVSRNQVYNGSTWDRARGDTTNGLDVDVTRLSSLVAGSAIIGALTANQSVNNAQVNGITILTGTGATGTGAQRVTVSVDSATVAGSASLPTGTNNIGDVDIVSGTVTTVSTVTNIAQQGGVAISLNTGVRDTGTQRVTIATNDVVPITDNSGSLTVDAPVGTPVFATITPSTTGGWSVKSLVALSNTKTAVKAGVGTMGGYMFYNPNSSVVYLQVWNVAIGSVTVGTTTPTYVIPIPATAGANVEFTNGINHSTEINIAVTTTATGSTAPSTAVDGFMLFK